MTIDATRTEREAGQMLIGGEDVEAASGERLDVLNPATGQPITQIPAGDAEDVDRAVHAARRGRRWRGWSGRRSLTASPTT